MNQLIKAESPSLTFDFIQSTKDRREDMALKIIEQILEGDLSPLTVHLFCKNLTDFAERITKNTVFRNELIEEAEIQGKKFEFGNGKMEVKEVGTKYHFENCNDPELGELYARRAALDQQIEAREKYLKALPTEGVEIVKDECEIIRIYPPYKTSTTSVAVTLK